MEPLTYELPLLTCKVCGYEWIPRSLSPKKCPSCSKPWRVEPKDAATVPAVEPPRKFIVPIIDDDDYQKFAEMKALSAQQEQEYRQRMEIERRKLDRPLSFFPD